MRCECKTAGGARRRAGGLALLLGLTLFLPGPAAGASDIGLTVSTNTFAGAGPEGYSPIPPGLYTRVGIAWLPGRHLEFELYHIPQLTPDFYSQVLFGGSVGYWFLPRGEHCYLNAALEVGFLYGLDQAKLVNLKVTPAVFGCPSFGYAERFCTVGILFDPERLRVLWQIQILALTLFL